MRSAWAGVLIVCTCIANCAQAASIDLGHHILLPDTPNQVVPIFARGDELLAGMDIWLRVVPLNSEYPRITGGVVDGPGMLFEGGDGPLVVSVLNFWSGEVSVEDFRQLRQNSLIATLIVDTSGIMAGPTDKVFALMPYPGYPDGPGSALLRYLDRDVAIYEKTPGSFTIKGLALAIVPEPPTLFTASLLTLLVAAVYLFGGLRDIAKRPKQPVSSSDCRTTDFSALPQA